MSDSDHESEWESESESDREETGRESDHESEWETDSEVASGDSIFPYFESGDDLDETPDSHLEASFTADQIANDATPTSRSLGGEFSGMLDETIHAKNSEMEGNYLWSRGWKQTAIRWAQRHVDCMELLQRIHGKHDYGRFVPSPHLSPTADLTLL
jgi:hypothetical protein